MNQTNKYEFQDVAIRNIVSDFKKNSSSRLLLVIPTGGGKTLTAIRSVNEMILNGDINEKAKCLWITHRKALKKQTSDVRDSKTWFKKFNFSKNISNLLQIEMLQSGIDIIKNDKTNSFKYVIIDECHHAASKSYNIFFKNKNLGILGLTATPTRLDRRELAFDKTSYQITFRKLVSKGVIIKPEFVPIPTNETIRSSDISLDSSQSEKFNTLERNYKIVDEIASKKKTFSKIVVYVNTVNHAKALYQAFNDYFENDSFYEFIGFISASENHLKIDNNLYLDKFKSAKTGIIINTNILTEGYDDPSINTVAMGVPTSSLVRYIQCVGRAIRNPDQYGKINEIPHVIEFSDNLPDISYRITSGWLFADISDDLQPIVKTVYVRDDIDLKHKITSIVKDYKLKDIDLNIINNQTIKDFESLNLFCFNTSKNQDNKYFKWRGYLVDENTRENFIFAFNNISNAIFNKSTPTHIFDYMLPKLKTDKALNTSPRQLNNLYHSMKAAYDEVNNRQEVHRLRYFIFEKIPYPVELENFLADCFNKDDILKSFDIMKNENKISYVLKFPSKYVNLCEAMYCSEEQYQFCLKFIEQVREKIENKNPFSINSSIQNILDNYDQFNIPMRFIDSLFLINKDKIKFKYKIIKE